MIIGILSRVQGTEKYLKHGHQQWILLVDVLWEQARFFSYFLFKMSGSMRLTPMLQVSFTYWKTTAQMLQFIILELYITSYQIKLSFSNIPLSNYPWILGTSNFHFNCHQHQTVYLIKFICSFYIGMRVLILWLCKWFWNKVLSGIYGFDGCLKAVPAGNRASKEYFMLSCLQLRLTGRQWPMWSMIFIFIIWVYACVYFTNMQMSGLDSRELELQNSWEFCLLNIKLNSEKVGSTHNHWNITPTSLTVSFCFALAFITAGDMLY